jgi:hypothetical protein
MLALWPAVMEANRDGEDFSKSQGAGLRRLSLRTAGRSGRIPYHPEG